MIQLLLLLLLATPVWAASNILSWTDNATNESVQNIVRGTAANVSCVGVTYAPLATVPANITTYTDAGVVEGTVYCYQVNAQNSAGTSPMSVAAGRLVPFTVPAAPSGLGVVGGP